MKIYSLLLTKSEKNAQIERIRYLLFEALATAQILIFVDNYNDIEVRFTND